MSSESGRCVPEANHETRSRWLSATARIEEIPAFSGQNTEGTEGFTERTEALGTGRRPTSRAADPNRGGIGIRHRSTRCASARPGTETSVISVLPSVRSVLEKSASRLGGRSKSGRTRCRRGCRSVAAAPGPACVSSAVLCALCGRTPDSRGLPPRPLALVTGRARSPVAKRQRSGRATGFGMTCTVLATSWKTCKGRTIGAILTLCW